MSEVDIEFVGCSPEYEAEFRCAARGYSAYEIAVANGFVGTEQEWLDSLHGAGGQDGQPGQPGQDGYTPIKGVDYFDGQNGRDGVDGQDGYTPVKGVDYFDGKDGTDAAVTADSVNLAFASASDEQKQTMRERINAEKSKGVYELIETITLTEDTASIVRTQEPDGTPYAFKAIGVVAQAEVGSVNCGISVIGNYKSTRLHAAFINGAISNSIKKYGYAQIYPDWGTWAAIGSTAVNGFSWTVTQMTGYSPGQAFSVKESENPYCTQVTLIPNASGTTMPTGTIIQIYGVRA